MGYVVRCANKSHGRWGYGAMEKQPFTLSLRARRVLMTDSGESVDGGSRLPLTKTQAIAEDIKRAFQGTSEPALWTSEIVEQVNEADKSDVLRVLAMLQSRGLLESKLEDSDRIWWISY